MSAVPELVAVPKRLRPFVTQPHHPDAPHSLTSEVQDGDVASLSSSSPLPVLKMDDDTNPKFAFKRYTPPVPASLTKLGRNLIEPLGALEDREGRTDWTLTKMAGLQASRWKATADFRFVPTHSKQAKYQKLEYTRFCARKWLQREHAKLHPLPRPARRLSKSAKPPSLRWRRGILSKSNKRLLQLRQA